MVWLFALAEVYPRSLQGFGFWKKTQDVGSCSGSGAGRSSFANANMPQWQDGHIGAWPEQSRAWPAGRLALPEPSAFF